MPPSPETPPGSVALSTLDPLTRWEVGPDGIRCAGLMSTRAWRWDEIACLTFVRMPPGLVPSSLKTRDGGKVNIPWARGNAGEVAAAVERHYTRPRAEAAARAIGGGAVTFGPVTASRDGLRHGEAFLPWHEIALARVDDVGFILIASDDGWKTWFRAQADEVRNSAVLLALIQQVLTAGARRPETPDAAPDAAVPAAWGRPQIPQSWLPELGTPAHEYRPDPGPATEPQAVIAGIAIGVILLLGAAGVALFGAALGKDRWLGVLLAGVVGVSLIVLIAVQTLLPRRPGDAIRVYRDGLAWLRGEEAILFPWPAVTRFLRAVTVLVGQGHRSPPNVKCTVERPGTPPLKFRGYRQEDHRLAEEVGRRTHGPMMRRALDALDGGREVSCGPVVVTPAGITVRGVRLPWQDVTGVTVRDGSLHVTGRSGGLSCAVGDVANFHVLLDLIDRLRGQAARGD